MRIYTSLTICHIHKFLIRLFIFKFFLKCFRIGISNFVNIHNYPLIQDLKTRKNRRLFRWMILDISIRKSKQDKSYNKFNKIFSKELLFFSIHTIYNKKINHLIDILFLLLFKRLSPNSHFPCKNNDKTIHIKMYIWASPVICPSDVIDCNW